MATTGVNKVLSGRRILVTGASSGIGAATCRSIVARGGSVAMVARRKDRLDALAEELGEGAFAVAADVTDLDGLEGHIGDAAAHLGGFDGVVTVAGQMMTGEMRSGTPQRWRELLDLNLVGPLATVRYALPHFVETGRRDVVLIGSTGAVTPMPAVGIYAASKRGLEAAFDSLRLELAAAGINVSLVQPGMFETEGLTYEGIIFDGDIPPSDIPYFVPGGVPAAPEVLADCVSYIIGLPEGVCVHEMVVRPTGQLNP
jgi:NADP-dependent 3-hydroxy acid dehydrogenase YdfG